MPVNYFSTSLYFFPCLLNLFTCLLNFSSCLELFHLSPKLVYLSLEFVYLSLELVYLSWTCLMSWTCLLVSWTCFLFSWTYLLVLNLSTFQEIFFPSCLLVYLSLFLPVYLIIVYYSRPFLSIDAYLSTCLLVYYLCLNFLAALRTLFVGCSAPAYFIIYP